MRIAIPSDDRSTIAPHFGLTRGFLVFHVNGSAAELEAYRPLEMPQHECACSAGERPSRHQLVLDALTGCRAVIARGMGTQMYDDLEACGIAVSLTVVEDARKAIDLFLTHSLPERADLGCETQH